MTKSASAPATGADIVAAQLRAAGVTHAFGMPGGEVLALVDALGRAGIRFVLTRHETGAGFMAEGLWHATGAPPVLVTTLGPGLTNAVNVVAHAHQDRVPLIVISGCVDAALAHSYTHQIFDHAALMRPITKATLRVERGAEALVTAKALRIARAPRPGPVHLDLPIAVAEALAADVPGTAPVDPAPAVPADMEALEQTMRGARRPLILAGLDILSAEGGEALSRLADAIGAPVLTTYKAKGLIPESDPRVVGAVGLSPKADAIVKPLFAASDLIVLAGYDPIEMRAGWRHPWPPGKTVVELVAAEVNHGMHEASLTAVGDVASTMSRLAQGLSGGKAVDSDKTWDSDKTLNGDKTWDGGEPARARAALRDAFARPVGSAFGPHAVFAIAHGIAPSGTVASADSGAHRILLSQMWACDRPRGLIQSSGFCTMGGALPLAAGHALGSGAHTLCFVGDAGLEMVLGELASLRDLSLPVIVVVLVDRSLALIELKQRAMQLPRQGVDFGGTDFAAVASALGLKGAHAADEASFAAALGAAFRHSGPMLIAAEIGDRAYDGAF